tara:strand:+ start:3523 stop:3870 length:348 start_codon:yes stop_codon:yes gene_type:complete
MNERKNYSKLSYDYDKWSYENSYNDVKVKELVKWINEEGRPLERKEILEKSKSIFIKERTLADILKKLVLTKKIKRLRHGVYLGRCIRFYTYDNHVGESRWCVNCGQPESQHKRY